MIDREDEKKARETLLGDLKSGDCVKISGGMYRGLYGVVSSVTDDGEFDVASVIIKDTEEWAERGGRNVVISTQDLVKKWPGLNPGDTPVGGWGKLLVRQEGRHPQPSVGQIVQSKNNGALGRVTHINEKGSVGYLLNDPPTDRITGNMGWSAPHELMVLTYIDGNLVRRSDASRDDLAVNDVVELVDYARDVKAEPATPILDLPDPYCRTRRITKVGDFWEAQDEVGNPIGMLRDAEAYNLSAQLFWEFGL